MLPWQLLEKCLECSSEMVFIVKNVFDFCFIEIILWKLFYDKKGKGPSDLPSSVRLSVSP